MFSELQAGPGGNAIRTAQMAVLEEWHVLQDNCHVFPELIILNAYESSEGVKETASGLRPKGVHQIRQIKATEFFLMIQMH